MKTAVVIHNPASGTSVPEAAIRTAFGDSGHLLHFVNIADGQNEIEKMIKDYNAHIVIAAGGDGTVNCAANICVSLYLPLGVLPVGTLNHFAKDMNLPIKLTEAAALIQKGKMTTVDYGSVTGHVFVNNSSIGIYPASVLKREQLQSKIGKWPSAVIAMFGTITKLSTTHLRIQYDSTDVTFKTPLLFVGNNSYNFDKVGFVNRKSLTAGDLYLYIVRANRVSAFIRLVVSMVFGKRPASHDFIAHPKNTLTVNSRKNILDVAVDGEILTLQPPLKYELYAQRLKVFAD
ncbi:NAD(+)/NADH kinase [Polaromonas sp.]|nr:NAD(+)/NADH kinase [Candidatus Saccharibacteria bacterium]